MKTVYCVKKCNAELDNEHITWCEYRNKDNEIKYSHILNGDINEKKEALKQIKQKNLIREEEMNPVIQKSIMLIH